MPFLLQFVSQSVLLRTCWTPENWLAFQCLAMFSVVAASFVRNNKFLRPGRRKIMGGTVEPRFNEPLFNEVLDITNDILCPGQSYSKMYGIEPRYNEPRYNEFFDITNIIRKPKRKVYLDITNYNVNTRQKINRR